MMEWLEELGVEMVKSDMSFSVSTQLGGNGGIEWGCHNGVSGLLAQKSNSLSPSFWRMIHEIFKFKNNVLSASNQLLGGPECLTVKDGLQSFMNKVRKELDTRGCKIKTNCEVKSVSSFDKGYRIIEVNGSVETYDRIIFAIRAPDALKVLGSEATNDELRTLGAFQYTYSDAYLHHDESLMPRGLSAWSARNFLGTENRGVCITYWLNLVQAGKAAASNLLGKKCDLAVNIKVMVPSWTEAGARVLVGRFLKQYISIGNLSLIEQGGSTFSFGEVCQECCLKTVLQVHNPGFYWKVATEADLGLADAYINGYYSFIDNSEGLLNLLLILISNRDAGKRSNIKLYKSGLVDSLACILWSNDFFALFLDPTMSYSSGIFKANVERDHHVLEIGSGWGTLAIQLVKETGCRYTGITLSDQQLVYAQRKVKEAGLEDHITFLLCDYRQIPSCHKYDRIISCVEHVENIGYHYYSTLMRWRDNFEANRDKVLALGFDDKFIRTWEYYFIYCAAGFKSRTLGDYQIVFSRPGNLKLSNYVTVI
ncbi:hypothetical protein PR202_gb20036 [Eleusine coracana subsp. coracana]|uniref:Amine oxidase domain-containing protein n=1 Tax=Eleusine coracana subsp. coracana TaxID=191504 RepID=A0AAV5F7H8_ELECO|nr:hypothetical protein PR202_gb20036 [Eleusine coracana subsp. coracana]